MSESETARDLLRNMPVFPPTLAGFDPEATPDNPLELFLAWLSQAVDAGVLAPHAVNLATIGLDGMPDARIVILKDVGQRGFSFASSSASPKGRQLQDSPSAALTFFWPAMGRQIRIRGSVSEGQTAENAQDFRRRNPVARALVLAGRQSEVMMGSGDDGVQEQLARLDADDEIVSADWTVFTVAAETVEFWQADTNRRHTRLRYSRAGRRWDKDLLWP
ncbi:pyridoxine/pyridoxamine 5'-phosphate oxidase [Arthrobacter castelli]|uniref:pyridoxine/pyridoxamine 5'-phosphate oxidase n=1 Tax=Arthrobacter castelli TaxID=271431 RepID=UPI00047A86AD|nr:pyridoxal 5'-phosphate synthase [Arthrobacter castelli]